MPRVDGKDDSLDALTERYFENQVRRLRVLEPPVGLMDLRPRNRALPFSLDALLRTAAAALCAACIAVLPGLRRDSTPLREAVGRALREKTYLQYAPDMKRLQAIIRGSFQKKEKI